MAWAALPQGVDIDVAPGDRIAAVVSVGKSVSQSQLAGALASHFEGLVLDDYAEQGQRLHLGPDPDTDRKYIAVAAHSASYAGSLSWSKSIWLIAPNLYTIVEAWKLPAGSAADPAPQPTPPGPKVPRASQTGVLWAGSLALIGSAGYLAWASRGRLQRLLRLS